MTRGSRLTAWAVAAASHLWACAPVPRLTDKDTGAELILIKGGCFSMGSAPGPGGPDEKPAHEVCVGDFYLGKHEVTQGEWAAIMGANPSHHKACGSDCPVEMVSWEDVAEFLSRLNARSSGRAAGTYRLPTEAEWEYAARGGGRAEQYAGSDDDLGSVGWFVGNAPAPRRVGTKAANRLGLHDLSGNVAEWVGDWYDASYYTVSPRENPRGPAAGQRRVVRGGSFGDEAFDLRTTYRNHLPPGYRSPFKGFRLARSAPPRAW